ncbi:MAG: hypothetical protein JWP86_1740 [Phenylobacterium sp.]|nr:hypothetical protein [Phenylobacterium sp.]MDB5494403.1 hypothetical protein [Phenylobacterium sp.]
MLRPALALMIATVSASAVEAAEPPALCKALHGLADTARQAGEPQRISIIRGDRAPFICRAATPGAAGDAVCHALSNTDPAVAAWMIAECVQTVAADPQITTASQPSGYKTRKRLTHLAAKLGDGVRLDLADVPPPAGVQPLGWSYGRVDAVVWRPK